MNRAVKLLTAVALIAIAVGVLGWLVGRTAWQPPAPIKPALPEVVVALQATRGPASQGALQKPLFWSTRAPAEAVKKASEPAAVESEMAQMRLMAVLESGGHRVALLQRPDRTVLKLDSAESKEDWRLESFDGVMAVLVSKDGQRIERLLERAPSGAPTPNAPGARNRAVPGGSANDQGRPPIGPPPASPGTPAPASGGVRPAQPGTSSPPRPPAASSPGASSART